jgi:hypothetical protein
MTIEIQQSTTQSALLFFLVLTSDHISPATGLSPTVTLSKNGGAFASPSGTVSEIANGWYKVAGNATDTGTLGPLALHASVATADNCDLVVANIVAYNPQSATLGLFTQTLTESYPAINTAPTLAQAIFLLMQRGAPTSRAVSGTTETITKLDGSTTAATFTLNSSSNPSSVVRAS